MLGFNMSNPITRRGTLYMGLAVGVLYGGYDYYTGGWDHKKGEPSSKDRAALKGLPEGTVKQLPDGTLLMRDGSIVRGAQKS